MIIRSGKTGFQIKKGTPSTRSAVLLNAKEKPFSLEIYKRRWVLGS